MPTYSEIMKLTGFKSKNAVAKLVDKLVQAGVVSKDSEGRLIPAHIYGQVTRLSQVVSAGTGAEVSEELADTVSLDEWLTNAKIATYMLEVQGDSMMDAGILDGDTVLVEKTSNFKDGQIVVAQMNDGFTIKYLSKTAKGMHLIPANKKYKNIYPSEDNPIDLIAVVKTVIREL